MNETGSHVYHLKVDSAGRVVLPSAFRHRTGIEQGTEIVAEDDGHGILIKTYAQVLRDVQEFFQGIAPPGVCLSEELIRERRQEAAREDHA